MKPGLVIIDRDGVINFDSDAYIKSVSEWAAIPGSLEALARLSRADYRVVVATNQSGIARGLFDMETLNRIHQKMTNALSEHGGRIDAIFFCPHGPDDGCDCRKPEPGLLHEIIERLKVGLVGVPVVGDSLRDLESAEATGALPILVRTGKGLRTWPKLEAAQATGSLLQTCVFDDLAAFAENLLRGNLENAIAACRGQAAAD
ncbi:MAG TPA: D-glycero-beta-D-manno-heptose-1,7-bisphosphate 7-phosphatase [Gammaproteobacteria bacterium]|jgi:D-glycero-D-manno-heptose 1,7-bisphosphate phosphatase|nr:D-glycero-beta-D-manno-heptose-1,7-bisphosphate 7-phosphatase [Acidiferrobacteraceae bacterium]MDP6550726.1 D-glycero-beta-D-manno-heptose 1,7-bisphosphate 7-phosphatase [Arenicellales bacterium]MDP6790671.1 D-glycero-beta-D-manno-heptose 1,7-bisphosphate 7-phosphatase [Arenicellales bacterium]MDP6918675.1 D-glycero-beta-D-manno-heptose 1,7-bisphosphate 7-phosphatase [Arenicellales bacterium]HCX88809.1 D-glycero-beta-D-manno-heptose-1,7-bisphosphate 7-phosphatase [Gammaproteobacteria bacteri|tara:strand:- start:22796 stop:23404 length:609 start_codon:yes stop_codon:yes gene_type:complete